jgi:allophanate hydrolase subunit 1
VEDLNTLLLDLRALAGVYDAQGGVTDLTVTYNPQLVTRQAIIDAVKKHGYQVEEKP